MSKEATYFLLNKFGIKEKDIEFFRYRGNGWPSGVQIKTRTNEYFFHNNKSIWTDIFNSHLFNLKRCFSCKNTFGLDADISVADPWLERYTTTNHTGATTVLAHNGRGNELITKALEAGALSFKENLSHLEVIKSQEWTLKRKDFFCKHKKILNPFFKFIRSKYYINFLFKFNLIRIHSRLLNKMLRVLARVL
jgi:coenzyme F420-reducing hydrogenase beta subunit